MTKKNFVNGTIILMLAGFIVKIFGFVYRIYLSNLIGAEGMGLFQLISPIYSLIILTLTSGVSVAVSKIIAEELAIKRYQNLKRITSIALALVVVGGIVISIGMFISINFIVNNVLKDQRTYYSMLLLIPCIPVIAAASAIKGYFYGMQNVTPTAISQIVEQIVKIVIVMGMASFFVNVSLAYACALATVGMAFGEIANLIVLYIIYKKKPFISYKVISKKNVLKKRYILRTLIRVSTPISFNRFITSIMSAIELILIPHMLLAGGLNYQTSIEEYGKLTGMAMPLIFFPALVTSSLATTLVPAISEALSLKNFKSVNYRISKSIQFTFILGFLFTSIFIIYPQEISDLVYRNENISDILYQLSFTCIFVYLQQTLLGILNGLDKQGISLANSTIGYIIRIAFVYLFIPSYGIKGYVWGIIVSLACVCILNLNTIIKTTGMMLDFRNWIIKPLLISLAMLLISKYVNSFFEIFKLNHSLYILLCISLTSGIGIFLMTLTGALDKEDILKMIPLKLKKSLKLRDI